jgi:hypothetical protein
MLYNKYLRIYFYVRMNWYAENGIWMKFLVIDTSDMIGFEIYNSIRLNRVEYG